MIRTSTTRSRLLLAVLLAATTAPLGARQADDGLRTRVAERYRLVELQNGVGLVPLERDAGVQIIEIRDGAVAVDGQELTGRELRERLGGDADLVLRVSYLDLDEQRQLLGAAPVGVSPQGAAEPPPPVERTRQRTGDVVRVMGDVAIERDERVEGNVVVVMGNARIDGEVDGEVTVVMGSATLGPDALITDDLTIVGGGLNRAPGARVNGSIEHVEMGDRRGFEGSDVPGRFAQTLVARVGSLAGTLVRVALLVLLTLAVVALGRRPVGLIADRTAADPVRAGLVGFVAQLLFLPVLIVTIVVLAVSIVGIPLLLLVPFAILLLLVVVLVGFTGVAYQVGRMLNARFGWTERGDYATVMLGVVTIAVVTVLARSAAVAGGTLFTLPLSVVGLAIEYGAWTLGFGAAILVWLQGRRTSPPPIPAS